MEMVSEMASATPIQPKPTQLDCKSPPHDGQSDQNSQNSCSDSHKTGTPDRLKVPKAFKYPERYTSPTDLMMSPVSKGLLARTRKTGSLLPPTINQPKMQIQESIFREAGLFQN